MGRRRNQSGLSTGLSACRPKGEFDDVTSQSCLFTHQADLSHRRAASEAGSGAGLIFCVASKTHAQRSMAAVYGLQWI